MPAPGGWAKLCLVSHLLVAGTDTAVGKTVISAALLLALRERGVRSLGYKPAETGLEPGVTPDSQILAQASGEDLVAARPLLQLAEPLAPAVAARRAGQELSLGQVVERIRGLQASGFRLVVEGAGGLLVPLGRGWNAADLALACGLRVLLVARAGLGTLNQVLLTVEALAHRGVPLAGLVLNGRTDPPTLAEATNPEALAQLLPGLALVSIPRFPTDDALAAARRAAPYLAPLL